MCYTRRKIEGGVGALREFDDANFLKPNGQSRNLNIYATNVYHAVRCYRSRPTWTCASKVTYPFTVMGSRGLPKCLSARMQGCHAPKTTNPTNRGHACRLGYTCGQPHIFIRLLSKLLLGPLISFRLLFLFLLTPAHSVI